MGSFSSKPPPPPPKPLCEKPWRETVWSKEREQSLKDDIKRITPKVKPTLLFIGPVNAGKSSLINSALSIGKGHVVESAATGSSAKSFTTNYKRFKENTLLKHFRLKDVMGIEPVENEGFHVNDIVKLILGHVKDGYPFNPRREIDVNDKHYRKSPTFEHRAQCVVFVVDVQVVYSGIPESYVKKIGALQERINDLGVTRVLILTHADKLCAEVDRDIRNIFLSCRVEKAVKLASEIFHIPISAIHPVVNYAKRPELDTNTNIPLLMALRQMMQFANDKVEREYESNSESGCDSDDN